MELVEKDLKYLCFSKEMVDVIRNYDKSIEIIGIAGNLQSKNNFFKFTLSNPFANITIQVIAWEETKETTQALVHQDCILHLDGIFVKEKNQFSKSTVPFDLVVKTNTKSRSHRLSAPIIIDEEATVYETLDDAVDDIGLIEINCYIMQKIASTNKFDSKIFQGCITDLKKKLEIRVSQIDEIRFEEGDYIKVKGRICVGHRGIIYLSVSGIENIQLIVSKKILDTEMDSIYLNAKRKSLSTTDQHFPQEKKMKM